MLTPQVGALSGLDGQGGMMRNVTEHIRARNKAAYGAALYKKKRNVLPLVAVTRPRRKTKQKTPKLETTIGPGYILSTA